MLLLGLITLPGTYTFRLTPLDEGSARHRGINLYSTQHLQEPDILGPGGIRTRNIYKKEAEDTRLRLHRYAIGFSHICTGVPCQILISDSL